MKEYEIWLVGGGSLCGECDEETANRLRRAFVDCKRNMVRPFTGTVEPAYYYGFADTEGPVELDMVQVAAINVRPAEDRREIGIHAD